MKPKTENEKRFLEALEELFNTYSRKNADYGDSFKKSLIKHGNIAGLVRIEDKMNRIENLIKNESNKDYSVRVKDESLDDTLLDAAGYLTMLYVENKHIKTMSDVDKARVILDIPSQQHLDQEEDNIRSTMRQDYESWVETEKGVYY